MVTSCNIQHLLDRANVLVDGQWGRWSQWARSGQYKYQENQRYRTRLCDSPSPTCEGNKCTGDSSQVQNRCESFKVIWINVFLVIGYMNFILDKAISAFSNVLHYCYLLSEFLIMNSSRLCLSRASGQFRAEFTGGDRELLYLYLTL